MRKIILFFLLLSTSIYGQTSIDVFKIEFLRTYENIQGSQNNYYTDLVDRLLHRKKDTLKYGFFNSNGQKVINAKYNYASDFYNGKANIILDSICKLPQN